MLYAALIPCGPAQLEADRLVDLLDALECHDPENCVVAVILNDANPFLADCLAGYPKCRVVDNPRHGEGWGWGGGLAAGEIWALELIAREYPDVGCLVKLDTDAIPIKPLSSDLEKIFADPTVGIAGSRIGPGPLPSDKLTNPMTYFAGKVRKVRAPISLWRLPRWHFRFAISGHHRWIASLFDRAEANGYIEGELIEGGSYALSMPFLHALVETGIPARWRDFLDLSIGEDAILTMLAYFAGFRAINAPLFCIEPYTLRYAPEVLLADPSVGVVHSLKTHQQTVEADLRKIFSEARLQSQPTAKNGQSLPLTS